MAPHRESAVTPGGIKNLLDLVLLQPQPRSLDPRPPVTGDMQGEILLHPSALEEKAQQVAHLRGFSVVWRRLFRVEECVDAGRIQVFRSHGAICETESHEPVEHHDVVVDARLGKASLLLQPVAAGRAQNVQAGCRQRRWRGSRDGTHFVKASARHPGCRAPQLSCSWRGRLHGHRRPHGRQLGRREIVGIRDPDSPAQHMPVAADRACRVAPLGEAIRESPEEALKIGVAKCGRGLGVLLHSLVLSVW